MKCRKCNIEIPEGSKFCLSCGASQEPKKRSRGRGNGQGCAIKRGGTWCAVYTEAFFTDENGKLHQKRRWKGGFKTKSEALAFASAPLPDAPKPQTLQDYWNSWKNSDYLDLGKSKQSAFRTAWNKLDTIAHKKVSDLTIDDLQNVVDKKAKTYYPAKDMKTLLSHLYKRAQAEGTVQTNLSEFIRLPTLEESEQIPFSEVELHKLWDAYGNGDHFIGFILLMIYSGMMPGELLGLKKSMVDLERREIVGAGIKTKERKKTDIVFPEMIQPVLEDLMARSKSRAGYVVGMNKDAFYVEYHKAVERAGVRDLPPYSCRHTTATALALGKIAPSVIQKVMRHAKFSTTERYIHPTNESAHEAINTMGRGKA